MRHSHIGAVLLFNSCSIGSCWFFVWQIVNRKTVNQYARFDDATAGVLHTRSMQSTVKTACNDGDCPSLQVAHTHSSPL